MLAVPAFDGKAGSYVIRSDGRIVINRTMGKGEPIYNFLAVLRERSDLSEKEILAFSRELQQEQSGARTVTAGGEKFYLLYERSDIRDWITVGMVPADIVNANMNTLQGSTIIIVGITLAGIAAFVIWLILRRNSASLKRKDIEILYREVLHNLKSIVSGQVRTKQLELSMDAINVSDEDVYCDKTRLNQVLLKPHVQCHQVYPCGRNGVGAAQAASKLTERQSTEKAKRRSRPRAHAGARTGRRAKPCAHRPKGRWRLRRMPGI